MNHLGTVRIETERLILRKFVVSDAQDMFTNISSDPKVNKLLAIFLLRRLKKEPKQ